jgi:hypothetical protein
MLVEVEGDRLIPVVVEAGASDAQWILGELNRR